MNEHLSEEESKMEPKPIGGTHRMVRVTDQNGREYVCPITALRHPDTLTEEERAFCDPLTKNPEVKD